jgi:quinohemoprotein amine dehydrogenase alpha subunit-like protein
MWVRRLAAGLALAAGTAAGAGLGGAPGLPAAAQAPAGIPPTEGWVLLVSRCVICHSVEIAVQQRQGPLGWGAIVDRMVSYGMPLEPHERQTLVRYLVRHYGDPDGR